MQVKQTIDSNPVLYYFSAQIRLDILMHLCAVNQLIERLTEDRRVESSRLTGVTVMLDLIL